MSKKIGLFFGSFNPIHVGHLIIANYTVENTDLDEVWFIVSPQNPFKKKNNLLNEYDRLHLVNLAIADNENLKVSDIEFQLPKPSYTIDTLVYLKEKYKNHQFSLLMGGDNLNTLHKWKNGDLIAKNYPIYVYERPGYTLEKTVSNKVHLLQAPLMYVSATTIRAQIKKNNSVKYLLTDSVEKYVTEMGFYK